MLCFPLRSTSPRPGPHSLGNHGHVRPTGYNDHRCLSGPGRDQAGPPPAERRSRAETGPKSSSSSVSGGYRSSTKSEKPQPQPPAQTGSTPAPAEQQFCKRDVQQSIFKSFLSDKCFENLY